MNFKFSAQSPARIKATKEVTGIDPNDVVVQCYPDRVKVIIEKSRLPRILSSQNLHFSNPLCVGKLTTHFPLDIVDIIFVNRGDAVRSGKLL